MTSGRKPVPVHLKMVCNNPGKRPLPKAAEAAATAIPGASAARDKLKMPHGMSEPQRKVWRRAVKSMPAGVVRGIDVEVLHQWVVARTIFEDADVKLRNSAMIVKSPNGMPVQSPLLSVLNRQSEMMIKLASELGFTPSARARLGVAENEPEEPSDFFG